MHVASESLHRPTPGSIHPLASAQPAPLGLGWTRGLRRPRAVARLARRAALYASFVLVDGAAVAGGYALALAFRFDWQVPEVYVARLMLVLVGAPPIYVGANLLLHVYWRGARGDPPPDPEGRAPPLPPSRLSRCSARRP